MERCGELEQYRIILSADTASAASGGCSEPKQGQRSQSARGFCPRSTMRVPQPDIGEHFGNADAVPQPPERCLSRKAGIVRCCLTSLPGKSPGKEEKQTCKQDYLLMISKPLKSFAILMKAWPGSISWRITWISSSLGPSISCARDTSISKPVFSCTISGLENG